MTLRCLLGAVSALALGVFPLRAQTDVWIVTSGNWSNPSSWNQGVPANDGSASVSFGGTPGAASSLPSFSSTVDANFSIKTLTITPQVSAFTLGNANGAGLTIGQALVDQSLHAVTLAVPLSGAMTLENTGTGALTISGTQNTFTSTTAIESGSYQDANANAFSAASLLEVASGATVNVNHNETISALNDFGNAGGSVVLASGTTLTMNAGITSDFSGVLSGAGGIEKDTTGTLILTGANTYTGPTVIGTGAAISIGNNGTTGSIASPSVSGAGAISFDRSNAMTYSGALSGALNVVQNGSGTTLLSGTNTYTGPTTVNAGILRAGAANAFGAAGMSPIQLNNAGTLDLNNFNVSVASIQGSSTQSSVTLGSGILTLAGPNAAASFSGTVSGAGSVDLDGLSWILSGSNTYTGGTTITRGILVANNAPEPGGGGSATGTGNITIMPSGILELGELSAAGAVSAPSIIDNGSIVFSRTDSSVLTGNVSGTGGVTQLGSGTMTLSGTNTYFGATEVAAGTLAAGSASAFGGISLSPVTMAAGTLSLNGFSNRIGTLNGVSTSNLNLTNAFLTLGKSGATSSFPGVITGTGGLALDGAGQTTTLGGDNTFTGGVTVDSGTLLLGNAEGAGTGTITLRNGSVFSASGTGTSLTVNNPIAVVSGGVQVGANDDNALTFTGPVSGTASIAYQGGPTGTLTLEGVSPNLSGPFTLGSGTVVAASNASFGLSGNTVTLVNGSTLSVDAGNAVPNPIQFTGPAASTLTGGGSFSFPLSANTLTDIAPGRPVGTLTFSGGLTFATGSAFTLHVLDAAGAPGVGYGTLSAAGSLSFTANPGTLAFNLVSVNASGASANALNFNPSAPFSWTFATSSTPILGNNVLSQFRLNTSGFTNATNGGTFSFSEAGNDLSLSLNFTPVPEPSTYVLLAIGLLGLGPWLCFRRARIVRGK